MKKWIAVYVACDVVLTAAWKIQKIGPYDWMTTHVSADPLVAVPLTFVAALIPLGAMLLWHRLSRKKSPPA